MKAEKIRNLTDDELRHQERDFADQLFKLKFQINMGQTESLKKIRGLRRDIARVQTVQREQELAGGKAETMKTAAKAQPPKRSRSLAIERQSIEGEAIEKEAAAVRKRRARRSPVRRRNDNGGNYRPAGSAQASPQGTDRHRGVEQNAKTIVVEVMRKKSHPMYKRVIAIRKKFYAHDEKNEAHTGDIVDHRRIAALVEVETLDVERHCAEDGAGAGS